MSVSVSKPQSQCPVCFFVLWSCRCRCRSRNLKDLYCVSVPFQRRLMPGENITEEKAQEWLESAMGRGLASLRHYDLLAAHSLSSATSVMRAQLVVAEASRSRQAHCVGIGLVGDKSRVATFKGLWDETALRIKVSEELLRKLFGINVSQLLIDRKRESATRNRTAYPGFVVQSMQQAAFLRSGPSIPQGQSLSCPGSWFHRPTLRSCGAVSWLAIWGLAQAWTQCAQPLKPTVLL